MENQQLASYNRRKDKLVHQVHCILNKVSYTDVCFAWLLSIRVNKMQVRTGEVDAQCFRFL